MSFNLTPSAITAGSLESWEYFASYGDLRNWALLDGVLNAADSATSAAHYNANHVAEHRSITFDAWGYIASNIDLATWLAADGLTDADAITATQHYIKYGVNEGRGPIAFDADAYKAANPDLASLSWADAAKHYILAGRYEIAAGVVGRSAAGTPQGNTLSTSQSFTLTINPDVVPGLLGSAGNSSTAGNNTYLATNATLNAGDHINDVSGVYDILEYNTDISAAESGFVISGLERFQVQVNDHSSSAAFDLSSTAGVQTFALWNSTGNAAFNQVTELAALEVQNVTEGGNVALSFQHAVVAGATTVEVDLINNYNAGVGIITIGETSDSNGGIETVKIVTSKAASTVAQLDVDLTTLNIEGTNNLVITQALNGTETTINAGALNADLTLASTHTGAHAVTFTGAKGVDTVTFAGTTGNHTINSGDGNDVITLGLGDDTVNLGTGDDTLNIATSGLTVLDTINGGAGHDKIVLTGADDLSHSEVEGISSIEEFTMTTTGTKLLLLNNLLTSLSGPDFTVNMGVGGNQVDLTEVSFANTDKVIINGSEGSDLVIADDATVNAKATLNFGDGIDTLEVLNGAIITSDDMTNISGLDEIVLTADKTTPQTWTIDVNAASFVDNLNVFVTDIVPQHSVLNINNSSLTETVVVYANSNISVIPTGNVTVLSSLQFTETGDNLVGDDSANLFTASSLDQIDTGDNADGNDGNDTLRVDFAVNNLAQSLEALLNHANIHEIERLVFDPSTQTVKDVSFLANTGIGAPFSLGGDYDFTTFETSVGNDTIEFQGFIPAAGTTPTYTYLGHEGNDTAIDTITILQEGHSNNHIYFYGGTGNDTFIFNDTLAWDGFDHYAAGADYDKIVLNDAVVATIAAGQVADLVTDGALEEVDVNGGVIGVRANDADLHDFTGKSAVYTLNNLGAPIGEDLFFSAHTVADSSESVTVNASTDGDGLVVGGSGDDVLNINAGNFNGATSGILDALTGAVSHAGIIGLRGGDTINLNNSTAIQNYVVYKTAHDGALEGHNGTAEGVGVDQAQDNIHHFITGTDKIVFAYSAANVLNFYGQTAVSGAGNIGDDLDKNADGLVNARENVFVIDLDGAVGVGPLPLVGGQDELVLYSATGLTNEALLDVSGNTGSVVDYIAQNSTLIGESVGDVLVFAVHGTTDTAIYSYTASNTDGEVNSNEVALLGIVHDEHLVMTDFIYA